MFFLPAAPELGRSATRHGPSSSFSSWPHLSQFCSAPCRKASSSVSAQIKSRRSSAFSGGTRLIESQIARRLFSRYALFFIVWCFVSVSEQPDAANRRLRSGCIHASDLQAVITDVRLSNQ